MLVKMTVTRYRDHNARETGALLSRLNYKQDSTEFFVEASYYDNNREYAGSLTEEQYKNDPTQAASANQTDYSHEITQAFRAGYKQDVNESWVLGTDVIYDNTSGSSSAWGSSTISDSKQLFGSIKLENQFSTESGEGNALLGLEGANRDHDAYKSYGPPMRSNEQDTSASLDKLTTHFLMI